MPSRIIAQHHYHRFPYSIIFVHDATDFAENLILYSSLTQGLKSSSYPKYSSFKCVHLIPPKRGPYVHLYTTWLRKWGGRNDDVYCGITIKEYFQKKLFNPLHQAFLIIQDPLLFIEPRNIPVSFRYCEVYKEFIIPYFSPNVGRKYFDYIERGIFGDVLNKVLVSKDNVLDIRKLLKNSCGYWYPKIKPHKNQFEYAFSPAIFVPKARINELEFRFYAQNIIPKLSTPKSVCLSFPSLALKSKDLAYPILRNYYLGKARKKLASSCFLALKNITTFYGRKGKSSNSS